ncbi:hypothetical protein B0T24DRAFT_619748 [Lasiosphaeria ovina]|uniref:Uncharacterized protein n=1 Tax=Lasiosphaeria ovina TaxID=92902 RepID=A0AAE0KHR5_9PEZI|nr:hypothetical protein B0T24DRAFT_619748 [Lasiosphaeria ovina]
MESKSCSNKTGPRLPRLPRNVRDNIYRRVLVVPHPLYLYTQGTSDKVELFAPDRPARWLALLYTSRAIHDQAVETLYGSHQFVLVDTARSSQAALLQSFLRLIRPANVACLRHICINFPAAVVVDVTDERRTTGDRTGPSMLCEDELRGLRLIRDKCRGLTTVEMYLHNENSRGVVVAAAGQEGEMSRHVEQVLAEVDAEFRAIGSWKKKVIVRLYKGPLTPEVAELMQSFGWVVLPGK